MTKNILTALAVAASVFATAACTMDRAPSPTDKPPGVYNSNHESTSSNGTSRATSETTSVYVGADGQKHATVKTTTTSDPKGLFNKSTSTSVKNYNE